MSETVKDESSISKDGVTPVEMSLESKTQSDKMECIHMSNKTDTGDLERKVISESDYESDGSLEYTMDDIVDNISDDESEKTVSEDTSELSDKTGSKHSIGFSDKPTTKQTQNEVNGGSADKISDTVIKEQTPEDLSETSFTENSASENVMNNNVIPIRIDDNTSDPVPSCDSAESAKVADQPSDSMNNNVSAEVANAVTSNVLPDKPINNIVSNVSHQEPSVASETDVFKDPKSENIEGGVQEGQPSDGNSGDVSQDQPHEVAQENVSSNQQSDTTVVSSELLSKTSVEISDDKAVVDDSYQSRESVDSESQDNRAVSDNSSTDQLITATGGKSVSFGDISNELSPTQESGNFPALSNQVGNSDKPRELANPDDTVSSEVQSGETRDEAVVTESMESISRDSGASEGLTDSEHTDSHEQKDGTNDMKTDQAEDLSKETIGETSPEQMEVDHLSEDLAEAQSESNNEGAESANEDGTGKVVDQKSCTSHDAQETVASEVTLPEKCHTEEGVHSTGNSPDSVCAEEYEKERDPSDSLQIASKHSLGEENVNTGESRSAVLLQDHSDSSEIECGERSTAAVEAEIINAELNKETISVADGANDLNKNGAKSEIEQIDKTDLPLLPSDLVKQSVSQDNAIPDNVANTSVEDKTPDAKEGSESDIPEITTDGPGTTTDIVGADSVVKTENSEAATEIAEVQAELAETTEVKVEVSAVTFTSEEPDIYALQADTVLEVPTMNGNATFSRRKSSRKEMAQSSEDADSSFQDSFDISFSAVVDIDISEESESKSTEPQNKGGDSTKTDIDIGREIRTSQEPKLINMTEINQSDVSHSKGIKDSSTTDPPSEEIESPKDTAVSDGQEAETAGLSYETHTTDSDNTAVISDSEAIPKTVSKAVGTNEKTSKCESVEERESESDSQLHLMEKTKNLEAGATTESSNDSSPVREKDSSENEKDVEKVTKETSKLICDNSENNTHNVPVQSDTKPPDQNAPVQASSLFTICEDTVDGSKIQKRQDTSSIKELPSNGIAGSGVVMRKKAHGTRLSRPSPSFLDPEQSGKLSKDEILQQRIDFEIKMRDGTAKLLAASKHPSQMLEAAKSLLTSNTRMLHYMSELQRRKCEQAMHQKKSEEGIAENCKAKLCVSDLRIPLMWKETDYFKNKGDHRRFAVFCMVKQGTEIFDSSLVKEVDSSMTDIIFDDVINFNDVSPDFDLTVEVYCHKMEDDHAVASTPRKIKKKFNEFSTSVGRRLSGLKEDHDHMSHMIVGPKFEKLAEATMTLSDVSDTVCTYNLTIHETHTDKEAHHTELPLFGNMCCKIAAQPDCMRREIIASQLGVRRHKEKEMTFYWTMLKDQLLSFYSTPAQCHSNKTPALTIPVNKNTKLMETAVEGARMLEISNKTARVRTRYLLQADDVDSTQRWFKTLHQHIANQVSWQHACDIQVDLDSSPPQRASSFLQRKPTQSLYEETEVDSPMTRILNRLNIDLEEDEEMDTDKPSSDNKENTHSPPSGSSVQPTTKHGSVAHKAGKKNSRSRLQPNV